MGLWQKTLFYLGLVDEDAVDESDYGGSRDWEQERPTPQRRQSAETGGRPPGASQPQARQPQRPRMSMGRQESNELELDPTLTTGERIAASRRGAQPRVPGPSGVQGRRVEPPMTGRRRPVGDPALSESGVTITPADRPLVRTVSDADLECEVIVARSYTDAQVLADHIRANIPVVLDLRKVEPAMVRRLVDFSSGLTYALGGSMRKIGQGVVLVNPANVNISREEKRRLKELGYYQAPEE
ncbi:MAG TPA: cell division protein SepF [Acidimicrobiia bacterium]|nr:cell division protein SepF [Acidimicrobiia bacterium]